MGKKQKHEVKLTDAEKKELLKKISSRFYSLRQAKRAKILLRANKNQKHPKEDLEIANELNCCRATVTGIRERFTKEGLSVIIDKPRSGRPKKFDQEAEAHIIAITSSAPPEGKKQWTLRLIAEKLVAMTHIDSCSHQTVNGILKKMNLTL